MTVYDFLDWCCDARMLYVEVYDIDSGKAVFSGDYDDVPDELLNEELCSWDVPDSAGRITVNVALGVD